MSDRSRVLPMSPSFGFAAAAEYGPAGGTDGVERRAECGPGWFLLGVLMLPCLLFGGAAHAQSPSLMDELVKTAGFSESEVRAIGSEPLAREVEVADPSMQAAFVGIIRLSSDGSGLADALATIDQVPLASGIHGLGRFHEPGRPSDVAALRPTDSDLEVLADCQPNQCKFKLDRRGIDILDAIDWNREDAGEQFTARFRSEVLEYVERYRKQGNRALVLYADKPEPVSLASVLESIVGGFTSFRRQAPAFTNYLLTYPEGRQAGMSDSIVWVSLDFGYRETITLAHLVVARETEHPGATALIANKTIYANHYLAGRVQMGAVLDGEVALGVPGHFIVIEDRIAFDGALGGFKRGLLGRGLLDNVKVRLEMMRSLADGAR